MKNKLIDLNNHLFAQLERICDTKLTEENLGKEVERSNAVSKIASNIINNAKLALEASKAIRDRTIDKAPAYYLEGDPAAESEKPEKFKPVIRGIASRE
jgi:benzoyl-CoA reductase/2-hydroxyglutaryl-CoA dehydratase subunit BcrC/BadD/HgdB